MPWRDIEKQREAIRKHYYANRQQYLDRASRKRHDIKKWVNALKERTPCADCGLKYPYYVMDFDHLRDKKILISRVINRGSWIQVENELKKCELVCANCHRIRTFKRLGIKPA